MSIRASTSRFQTTSWSLVIAAAVQPTSDSRRALATLCQMYWHPIYAFIRRNSQRPGPGAGSHTRVFFCGLAGEELSARRGPRARALPFVPADGGKAFLANERDRAQALKRGGGQISVSIDPVESRIWYAPAAVDGMTPERIFERRWALSLLEQVMAKLRAGFAAKGKADYFDRLSPFLDGDAGDTRYEAVATGDGRRSRRIADVGSQDAAEIPGLAARGDRRNRVDAGRDRRRDPFSCGRH